MSLSRREFMSGVALGALGSTAVSGSAAASAVIAPKQQMLAAHKPVLVCAGNGYEYLTRAYAHLKSGGDTLDAAIQVVKGCEDDPNDDSVGLGGAQ